jgi:aminopeptidase
MLEQDPGAKRLGECALVPFPNPVSSQGVLFYNTLFDENAACHFALGACYETNLRGGADMNEEELKAHGANQSLIHVDFMVGTEDLRIVGTTWDGEEVTVFENGTWAI